MDVPCFSHHRPRAVTHERWRVFYSFTMDVAQMYPPRRAEPVDCNGLADPDVGAARRRVVVTGIGVVTPYGHDVEGFWQALLAGQSCIAPISRLDTSDLPVHFGGQVADVAPAPFLPASLIRRNDLSTNIGLLAGGLALESAGLGALAEQRRAISVIVGSAFGAMQGLQDVYDAFYLRGWRKMHPLSVPRNMFNSLSSNLSINFKLGGSHHTIAAACASKVYDDESVDAIAEVFV